MAETSEAAPSARITWILRLADSLMSGLRPNFHNTLSSQGERSGSGSGGRAGGERNGGGGGNGNQGIGGGGQRDGNERSNRGRNHGGGNGNGNGNGDDDGNDRRGLLGYVGRERGPMGPEMYGLAEMLLFLNAQMIGTVASIDIDGLPARARIYRVVSLGFNSMALVCLSASIGQRRTSPKLASFIAYFATLLGFICMIAMAISASFFT